MIASTRRPAIPPSLLLVVLTVACRPTGPVTDLAVQPFNSTGAPSTPWELTFAPGVDPEVQSTIQIAADWVKVLIGDAGFHRQLLRRRPWYASRSQFRRGQGEAPATVVGAVRDWTPERATTIALYQSRGSGVAMTDVTSQTISLRATRTDLSDCPEGVNGSLINTLLHERMHLIPDQGGYRFEDANYRGGWRAHAVSYQVGNIGQCYLEAQLGQGWGSLSDEQLDAWIDECMAGQDVVGNLTRDGACHPSPAAVDRGPAPS